MLSFLSEFEERNSPAVQRAAIPPCQKGRFPSPHGAEPQGIILEEDDSSPPRMHLPEKRSLQATESDGLPFFTL